MMTDRSLLSVPVDPASIEAEARRLLEGIAPDPLECDADGEDEAPGCTRITISVEGAPVAEVLNADDFPCIADDGEEEEADARVRRCDDLARAYARFFKAAPRLVRTLLDALARLTAENQQLKEKNVARMDTRT